MSVARIVKFGTFAKSRCLIRPNFNLVIPTQLRVLCPCNVQTRPNSTVEASPLERENLLKKFISKIPFLDLNKTKMMAAGYLLYEEIADKLHYMNFFMELELADTFYSWFVITELHVWMLSVRAMAEGENGKLLRRFLIEALWKDVSHRAKQLGAHNPSVTRMQIGELSEQLQATLIAYDEGLQGDDTILAGAIWRRFYQQQDVNPRCLDILVKYIRKQIRLLDHVSTKTLFSDKKIKWAALK